MKLLRTEYEVYGNKPVVWLFQREDGKRVITKDSTLRPYFYVEESQASKHLGEVDPGVFFASDGTRLKKLYTGLPEDVPKLREIYPKTWEADVVFPTRYLIDKVDTIEPTVPRVAYLDIEVAARSNRVPSAVTAPDPVVCMSLYDTVLGYYASFVWKQAINKGVADDLFDDSLHQIFYCSSEKEMLDTFIEFFHTENPDVLTGWNLIRFDMTYLLNRMSNLGMSANRMSPMGKVFLRERDFIIRGVAVVDLYDAYRRFEVNVEESYTLDFIGKKVTGRGKNESGSEVTRLWRNDLSRLVKYNVNDVAITRAINEKMKLLDFMDELRRTAHCQLEDTLQTSKTVDSYVLHNFRDRLVFPTKIHHKKAEFEGAFVGHWATGVYDEVIVFDLKSLYPSIIVSANLSPETMLNEPNGNENLMIGNYFVDMSKKGYLCEVILKLFEDRARYRKLMKGVPVNSDEWKLYDNRQYSIKVLLNSIYGQTAYVGSRIYDPRVAEVTTYMGRSIIKWSKEHLEELGYQVLYCDTDSLFWTAGKKLSIDEILEAQSAVNRSYDDFSAQFGITHHIFNMEFEKIYRKAFFGKAKKRYCGHLIWKSGQEVDELHTMGFEIRRSDASTLSKKIQEMVLDMLLRKGKSKDQVLSKVGDEIDRIRKGNFKYAELGIPKGVSQELDSYKTPGANIRGAKYTRDVLGIEVSTKPKMLYVAKMPDRFPPTDVICFDEASQLPAGMEIDVEKMLEKTVKAKLSTIFEALDWNMRDLVPWWGGKPQGAGTQLNMLEAMGVEKCGDVSTTSLGTAGTSPSLEKKSLVSKPAG